MPPATNDPDPAVIALGREVERLTRRSKAIEKRVEELAELLATLGDDVKTLLTQDEQEHTERVRAWLLTDRPRVRPGGLNRPRPGGWRGCTCATPTRSCRRAGCGTRR